MSLGRREKILLVVLGALLVVLAGRGLIRVASGGELGLTLGRGAVPVRGFDLEVAELRLADLDRRSPTLVLGRDPFRFAPKPAPAPPPAPAAPRRRRAQPPPQPPPPPAGPRPPQVTYDYLGSFGPERRKIAVLRDGATIHNALAGEVLEGKFVVRRIGYESVDIGYVDFPDEPSKRLPAGG